MNQKLFCSIPRPSVSYEIEIRSGILNDPESLALYLKSLDYRVAIVADDITASLYGYPLLVSLSSKGQDVTLFSFPHGEKQKTEKTKEFLENELFDKGYGRDTCLIALGGGVVTDLAGYLASTYCRGIPLIMIPTSLLGMVDASIGGKTGVNVPRGKNLIGTIYQPQKVFIDPSLLKSLPQNELKNGVVEMIKHGLIADAHHFEYLEKYSKELLSLDLKILEKAIYDSCQIKKTIVESDESEKGQRHLLNLGHTVGHALEKLSHYSLAHGEAVAVGLIVEAYLAMQLGHLNKDSFKRIQNILKNYGLPLKIPHQLLMENILETMILDKKSLKMIPRFVILKEIGLPLVANSSYCIQVEKKLLIQTLQWMLDHDLCSN